MVWAIVDALQRSHTVPSPGMPSFCGSRTMAPSCWSDSIGSLRVVGSVLSTDVAEVLAATAALLGVERAVQAALRVSVQPQSPPLPRLQPPARHREHVPREGSGMPREFAGGPTPRADSVPIAEPSGSRPARWSRSRPWRSLWSLVPQFWASAAVGNCSTPTGGGCRARFRSAVTYVGAAGPRRLTGGSDTSRPEHRRGLPRRSSVSPLAAGWRHRPDSQKRGIDTAIWPSEPWGRHHA